MFASIRLRRFIAALLVCLSASNLLLVNAAHADTLLQVNDAPTTPYYVVDTDVPAGFLQPSTFRYASASQGPSAPAKSLFLPKAPGSSDEAAPPKKGLWGRLKSFMADDWAETKEDAKKVAKWFKKPIPNFKIGWRKMRESVRSFRTKLTRGTKLFAASLIGRELQQEEEQLHLLLAGYIDQHGVEDLLKVLENSDDTALEQLALAGRKVEDPILKAQLMQRYVAREYLRMQKHVKDTDPEDISQVFETIEEKASLMEISDPDPELWQKPSEAAPAPVYTPYFPFVDGQQGGQNVQYVNAGQMQPGGQFPEVKKKKRSISLKKVLITVIGGVGLLLAGYFAFTTMTIAPFLAFISTFVSFIGATRSMNFGQRVVVVQQPVMMPAQGGHPGQQPFQGPWPTQPPTEEPPPLVTPPPGTPVTPTVPPGGMLPDPGASDPVPYPDPAPAADPAPAPAPEAVANGKINLNTASLAELQELPGVGPSFAKKIIAARKKMPFRHVDDLVRLGGFGKRKLKAISPWATL